MCAVIRNTHAGFRAIVAHAGCRLLTPVLVYCISTVMTLNLVVSITVTRGADLPFIGQSEVGP